MDDLNRSFEMMATDAGEPTSLGMWRGIDIYQLHGFRHITMHGGEIACLKGLKGLDGCRPFRWHYDKQAASSRSEEVSLATPKGFEAAKNTKY